MMKQFLHPEPSKSSKNSLKREIPLMMLVPSWGFPQIVITITSPIIRSFVKRWSEHMHMLAKPILTTLKSLVRKIGGQVRGFSNELLPNLMDRRQ